MSAIRSPATPVRSRIYEKIIWEIVLERDHESIADLVEDVKCRCARLRLPSAHGEINDALAVMGDKVLGLIGLQERPPATPIEAGRDAEPLTQVEATGLVARFKRQGLLKVMPDAPNLTQRQADRQTVAKMIAGEILSSIARCEDLEREKC